jgi:hypothetical protein
VLVASTIRPIPYAQLLITLMMEAASTSEMSVNFYHTTWHNNPEDSHLNFFSEFPPTFFLGLFDSGMVLSD